jgi:maltose alpha-D-glucosyltransferase/alpha-amylase
VQANAPQAVITTLEEGGILYDATASNDFRAVLLRSILQMPEQSDSQLDASHSNTDLTSLLSQPSHVSTTEQSNTSILYEDQAILKLYRHIQRGENPDVEVLRFLTNVGHFQHTPAYLGDLHFSSDGTTLAFLQAFAVNQGDGWEWTLAELTRFYAAVANIPAPEGRAVPPNLNAPTAPQNDFKEHAGSYLEAAELLGRRTADMHLALATPTDNPAFAVENFTEQDLDALRNDIRSQTDEALGALRAALPNLSSESSSLASQLLEKRGQLLALTDNITDDPTAFGARMRIHGDYHLGQILRTGNDFLIVDFEGEPARTLAERRRKHSPLKDVAGMLRSFSYAARAALPATPEGAVHWAPIWEAAAANSFLLGYREALIASPDLLPQAKYAQALLYVLLLEKALYELLYELNNRPEWLPIPLNGLLTLANPSYLTNP